MDKNHIAKRKQSHIQLAQVAEAQMNFDSFANFALPYKALPEIALADVDCTTTLLDKKLNQPLIIASMTGGVAHAKDINTRLAQAAEETKVALGVGSQRIALVNDDAQESFVLVRRYAPTTVVFANMAAVQLNYGYAVDHYQKIVDMIQGDGLYLHLNPLQEALQKQGDTNFSQLLTKIETLVKQIKVPVFVKEVGHGISTDIAKKLVDIGVKGIDVAGTGGTSWSWIEATNSGETLMADWFRDVGYQTAQCIKHTAKLVNPDILIASGGIRTPVQALKAHLLGANYYSAALPFLTPALDSTEKVVELIEAWKKGITIGLFSIGATNWQEAGKLPIENYTEAVC